MRADRILETVLYVDDLGAAEEFYTRVLGLEVYARSPGRQVFFKLAGQMLLLFNPDATVIPPGPDAKLPVPPHGAHGEGHVCFAASGADIAQWKLRLEAAGVAIEADFHWASGGRSIYFRDPSGNCLEFAEANIWGFEN